MLFEFFYCILLFYILVNNYEVTTWEGYYLELWSKDKSKPYISSEVFLNFLELSDIPMLSLYFNAFGIIIII